MYVGISSRRAVTMISGGDIMARGTRHNGCGLCSTILLPQVVGNKHGYLGPFPETFKGNLPARWWSPAFRGRLLFLRAEVEPRKIRTLHESFRSKPINQLKNVNCRKPLSTIFICLTMTFEIRSVGRSNPKPMK